MALGESQARQTLLYVLLKVLRDLLYAAPSPLVGHARCDPEGLLPGRCGEDRPEVSSKLLALDLAHHAEEVPHVVHLAPLVGSSLEVPLDVSMAAFIPS